MKKTALTKKMTVSYFAPLCERSQNDTEEVPEPQNTPETAPEPAESPIETEAENEIQNDWITFGPVCEHSQTATEQVDDSAIAAKSTI